MNLQPLQPFVPENSLPYIENWLQPYPFIIKIKKERNTKLGDYRKPLQGKPQIITVNHNMSKELCLLTLTHEIAHLIAFQKNSNKKILPHGAEWKHTFSEMILETIKLYNIDLQKLLLKFSQNPKASFLADIKLAQYFMLQENPNVQTLESLSDNDTFWFSKKQYQRLKKQKIRYLCKELSSGKMYLISPLAAIQKIITV